MWLLVRGSCEWTRQVFLADARAACGETSSGLCFRLRPLFDIRYSSTILYFCEEASMIQHVRIGLSFRREAFVDALASETLPALRAGFPLPHPEGCRTEIRSKARGMSCRQDKGVQHSCSQAHFYAVPHESSLAVDFAAQGFQLSVEVQYIRDRQHLYGCTGVSATFRRGAVYA